MDKISTIKENILYFIENQNIKKSDFYEKTDISASNFKGSGLNSEIGGSKIVKILTCYPEINPEWLLTGIGSMLRSEITPIVSEVDRTYKELADARLEVIEGLRFKIASLEQTIITKDEKIAELKYTQEQSFLYPNVAEPAPELIGKKRK